MMGVAVMMVGAMVTVGTMVGATGCGPGGGLATVVCLLALVIVVGGIGEGVAVADLVVAVAAVAMRGAIL